jgi:predicted Fe-S protein YdhL (DUF1289 family)
MNLILHFRGALSLTVFVAAAANARAQSAFGAAPARMAYQTVTPGVALLHASPVVYFRGILGMSQGERERALAGKPDNYKKAVLDKVQEYEALPPDIREARLRQTQLRWDLTQLMKLPPEARPAILKDITPGDRSFLEDRLRQWDRTETNLQQTFLANAGFLDSYLRWQASSPAEQNEFLAKLPPDRRQDWSRELARWETMPQDERRRLSDQFRQFFDLNPEQQQNTLTTFSESERHDMENTLLKFANLPPSRREACIGSFQKFAAMSPDERGQFLKNAARWEAMTAGERGVWRELVQRFPDAPPMPPGFDSSHYPPMPPGMAILPLGQHQTRP